MVYSTDSQNVQKGGETLTTHFWKLLCRDCSALKSSSESRGNWSAPDYISRNWVKLDAVERQKDQEGEEKRYRGRRRRWCRWGGRRSRRSGRVANPAAIPSSPLVRAIFPPAPLSDCLSHSLARRGGGEGGGHQLQIGSGRSVSSIDSLVPVLFRIFQSDAVMCVSANGDASCLFMSYCSWGGRLPSEAKSPFDLEKWTGPMIEPIHLINPPAISTVSYVRITGGWTWTIQAQVDRQWRETERADHIHPRLPDSDCFCFEQSHSNIKFIYLFLMYVCVSLCTCANV